MFKIPMLPAYALAVLVVGAAFFFWKPAPQISGGHEVVTNAVATTSEPIPSERAVPERLREYRSTAYHFSLRYPQELSVQDHAEGQGALTITFQNVERAEGFQVFIVPYAGAQVSEQRFKQDEPSGIRTDLTNVLVDGATAAAFSSKNAALGDTHEVWFVHGGFLYEVTTLKPLEAWLNEILRTWKFS